MAISIISQPSATVQPVYNPIYYEVSSTNTTQPNFNYVFQVFNGGSPTGTPLATTFLLPRPSTGYALYNPYTILRSSLSYDLGMQNITASTPFNNAAMTYYVDMGESYGSLSTGTTIYSGLAHSTSYAFNGVLSYEQYPTWPTLYSTDFSATTGNTIDWLTNQPTSGNYVRLATDRGCTSIFNSNPPLIYDFTGFQVVVYHSNGTSTTTNFSGQTHTNLIIYVPTGVWNINNAGSGTLIDVTSDLYYTVSALRNGPSGPVVYSIPLTFLIDQTCNIGYQTMRIMWLNRWGGWDFFNFTLASKETVNISARDSYKKTLPFNYAVGARQTTIIDVQGTFDYSVQSNWINDATSSWLKELVTSTEVYIIDTNGNAKPVQMDQNSYYVQSMIVDRLYSVTFSFTSSYDINSQFN